MYSFDKIKQLLTEFEFPEKFDTMVAVANGGIIPAAMLNQRLGLDFHIIKVSLRDKDQKPLYDKPRLVEEFCFDPAGKKILLVEDRVKTGASLKYAKKLLLESGAASVKTFAVNGPADYPLLDIPCFRFPWIV